MKCYFDTEFTGLHQNTTLISIGMIADDNRTFYGEFTDYDKSQVDEWIADNVISHLELDETNENPYEYDFGNVTDWRIKGDTKTIRHAMEMWFNFYNTKIEMWSDCLAYDWMLFCQLWGGALKVPEKIFYIPFDLCTLLKLSGVDPDVNREDFARSYFKDDYNSKHHALHDARIIKAICDMLTRSNS